ncbi:MAG: PQQ-dependent sugar dehydrogenase [Planctomycetota bacterium]
MPMLPGRWKWSTALVVWVSYCAAAAPGRGADPAPGGSGERRVPWVGSRITGTPEPPPPYGTEALFPGLRFDHPTAVVRLPGTDRLVVTEEKGKVYTFRAVAGGDEPPRADLALDLGAVPGLDHVFDIAFHPRFADNRFCYVVYALTPKLPEGTRVSRFTVSASEPPVIDPASEEVVITWLSGGHNGSALVFGADGMLYVSAGDSGDATPPDASLTGQSIHDLLASVLRIDVDRTTPASGTAPALAYAIPSDNPFVGRPGARGEVWAYGLRNPWRMCFDEAGRLLVADVGWELWEMLYDVKRGGNYGWSIMEGSQPVVGDRPRGPEPIEAPLVEQPHTVARSITGGHVVASSRLPELTGAYVYGDYVTGRIWGLRYDGTRVTWHRELADTSLALASFGLDHAGDVLLLDYDSGTLHRLVPRPAPPANAAFPTRLSDTGLFADTAAARPAPGVVSYRISAEAWADGTAATRLVALPGDSLLTVEDRQNPQQGFIRGKYRFPADGVLAKTIALETRPGDPSSRRRIETQILHFTGADWNAYSYLWNEAQTDADLVPADGATVRLTLAADGPAATQTREYRVVGRTECLICHTTRGGSLYGFIPAQLARAVPRPEGTPGDGATVDQLALFHELGLLAAPPAAGLVAPADPYDPAADLTARARSYLQMNCAHCHLRGGGGASEFDVRADVALERTRLVDQRPVHGDLGIADARLVAPGDPTRSVVYYRMATLGRGRMPHFGSTVVDERGLALVGDWIASLAAAGAAEGAAAAAFTPPAEPTPGAALRVLRALEAGVFDEPARRAAIAWGTGQSDPRLRDLFLRFVPEEARPRRLGSEIRAEDLLALRGDAERGRRLYMTGALSCRTCHRIGADGGDVGPALTDVGRRLSAAQIVDSLVEPSKSIDPKYATWYVEAADGTVHTGLLQERSEERIVLRDTQGRDHPIARGDVEVFVSQSVSLMPTHLLRDLSAEEAADLLAYLGSCR